MRNNIFTSLLTQPTPLVYYDVRIYLDQSRLWKQIFAIGQKLDLATKIRRIAYQVNTGPHSGCFLFIILFTYCCRMGMADVLSSNRHLLYTLLYIIGAAVLTASLASPRAADMIVVPHM